MKILYINDFEDGGGAETIFNLTYNLFKENAKKIILDNLIPKNKIIRFISKFFFDPILYFKIKKMIKDYNPDIIHLHNYNLAPLTVLLAVKGYNTVQTIHASGQICPSAWGVYKKTYEKCNLKPNLNKCIKNCFYNKPKFLSIPYYIWHKSIVFLRKKIIKYFIFPSEALKKSFEKNSFKNLYVLRNPSPYSNNTRIRNYNKKNNIILYVGKLIEMKGAHLLVDVLKNLDNLKNWKFIFIGDGDLKKYLEEKVKNDKRFVFLGWVNHRNLKNYYNQAKILVVPSIYFENYPTVILEGLFFNNIIIGSDRGGIPEMINDKLIFKIYDRRNNNLKEKILEIINNYEKYKKISKRDKENILKYTLDKYKDKLKKIYKKVLEK